MHGWSTIPSILPLPRIGSCSPDLYSQFTILEAAGLKNYFIATRKTFVPVTSRKSSHTYRCLTSKLINTTTKIACKSGPEELWPVLDALRPYRFHLKLMQNADHMKGKGENKECHRTALLSKSNFNTLVHQ